jgi:hypothetical protein
MIGNNDIIFFKEKINLISLIVVKSIKTFTITEHIILQYYSRN